MEATESFAADVAHELKNPLTSLRSAVETLPRIKAEESRERLTAIIQHDIRRLDRLISDISDASRLDAELARDRTAGLDVAALVRTVVSVASEVERDDGVRFDLTVALPPPGQDGPGYRVMGHDSRLGQVVNNLLDNARSFSSEDGAVRVSVRPARLDDEGRAKASRSWSTTTVPASRPMRSSASSSVSTRTAPIRASARIPGSACRSRARSSRRTAAASGR